MIRVLNSFLSRKNQNNLKGGVFQKGTENGHRSHERHEMATFVRNHET